VPTLTLYSRPDCHLCDQARDAILGLRQSGPAFELQEVDIERDAGLFAAYLERIPVVAVDGVVVSELELDISAVRARLDTVGA
jgi:hypothetical protein